MNKGINIGKWAASIILIIAGIATIAFMLACDQQETRREILPPPPSSSWGDSFSYRYEPPMKKSAVSVPATIVVVNPFYKEAESAFADPTYSKVAKGFSASMGVDMDKIVIAKGMTVKGPYAYLDEITYSDKKGSDLTLAPKVFITTQVKYIGDPKSVRYSKEGGSGAEIRVNREFEMKIGGWVSFVMQEPLSAEKMWIKKLELEDTVVRGIESYEGIPQYATYRSGCMNEQVHSYVSGYNRGKLMFDGKVDAMADMLKKIYPTIMGKCWTYIDAEEIISLKEKTKEIRILKRY
ncbi:MAG: hypothetical protein A4E71_01511 [Smithella sp. PtaU1.Bin162]|nr:MAG: hypothetical protein A4E71_01511 [Smithella sp. PtaU1.Bin162]